MELDTDTHQNIGLMVNHGQAEQLMFKVKAAEVKKEGEELRHKLVEIVFNCEEIKQLPPASKTAVFVRKNLRQATADTKQVAQKDEEFVWNGLGIIVPKVAEEKKLEKDDVWLI